MPSMRDKIVTVVLSAIAALGLLALVAEFSKGQTQVAPAQIKAPRFVALACIPPGSATASCAGLVYIDAITPAGTELKLIGAPTTVPFDPTIWSLIP